MNLSTFSSSVLILCVGLFCLAPSIETQKTLDEIAAVGRRLFGDRGINDSSDPLSFNETLEGLRDLKRLLKRARAEKLDTTKFAEWSHLTSELLSSYETLTSFCSISDDHHFPEVKRNIRDYRHFGHNVVSFLKNLAKNHFADCVSDLNTSASELLTEEQRKNLHQFNEMMNQASAGERAKGKKMSIERAWLMMRYMDGVVFEFMRAHGVADRVNYPERGHFSSELKRLLQEPCRIVRQTRFKIPVESIDASRVLEFLAPNDSEPFVWVEIYEACVGLDGKEADGFYKKYFERAAVDDLW